MEEYKVIITTSGLGSRLGNLTDYTNKSLIRITDKPAISYIIESYPKDINFIITLGYYGTHVRQFLSLAYPDRNFTFIEIDKYMGEGSSLGYSLLKCKDEINLPFIFHASDTILDKFELPPMTYNWVVGAYKQELSQYRTLNIQNDKLININEKGELGYDISYVGVAGIKDWKSFFYNLEKLITETTLDISDVHVINNMLPDVEFAYKYASNWYDVGNTTELQNTRKSFKSSIEVLDKKDESIFFFENFVIKFFHDEVVNKNRVFRARELSGLVPTIIDFTDNFYKYVKVRGNLFSKSVRKSSFSNLLDWSKKYLWVKTAKNNFQTDCYEFYINKTLKRIDQYLKTNKESDIINGEILPSIYDLINIVISKDICKGVPSKFHGDFILDNIIETDKSFTLIDWRQDFAGNTQIGDVYYDLAKLNHNLTVSHDVINRKLFQSDEDNCYILTNSILNECKEILHSFIVEEGYDLDKVNILTSIIWVNMAPLHEYPLNKFLFNFGKYNLYKSLITK